MDVTVGPETELYRRGALNRKTRKDILERKDFPSSGTGDILVTIKLRVRRLVKDVTG